MGRDVKGAGIAARAALVQELLSLPLPELVNRLASDPDVQTLREDDKAAIQNRLASLNLTIDEVRKKTDPDYFRVIFEKLTIWREQSFIPISLADNPDFLSIARKYETEETPENRTKRLRALALLYFNIDHNQNEIDLTGVIPKATFFNEKTADTNALLDEFKTEILNRKAEEQWYYQSTKGRAELEAAERARAQIEADRSKVYGRKPPQSRIEPATEPVSLESFDFKRRQTESSGLLPALAKMTVALCILTPLAIFGYYQIADIPTMPRGAIALSNGQFQGFFWRRSPMTSDRTKWETCRDLGDGSKFVADPDQKACALKLYYDFKIPKGDVAKTFWISRQRLDKINPGTKGRDYYYRETVYIIRPLLNIMQ